MEISLVDEDAHIEIIKGYKALRYKVQDNGKNINKILVFQQWLKLMIAEKGENGIISYCTKCYSFFYFENLRARNNLYHDNCNKFDFTEFCEYCDELFNEDSICCLRKSFDMCKKFCYEVFFDLFGFCYLFLPIITLMFAFLTLFKIITSKRIKKYDDINYIENRPFDLFETHPFYIFFFLISFVYSIAFLVPYFFINYKGL